MLGSKAPACATGFKAATADPVVLRGLWRRYPGLLVGMPTGSGSGIDALDFDFRSGSQPWFDANRHRLPETRTHVTRSGGLHLLFRHSPGVRNSPGKLPTGIDVRGDGGYIVYWPAAGLSVSSSAPLAAWPDWLLRLILPPPQPPPTPNLAPARTPSPTEAERMIASAIYRVETAGKGQRHLRLRSAALTIGGLLAAHDIGEAEAARVLLDAVVRAGGDAVNRRNARATIAWGLRQGATRPLGAEVRHAGR